MNTKTSIRPFAINTVTKTTALWTSFLTIALASAIILPSRKQLDFLYTTKIFTPGAPPILDLRSSPQNYSVVLLAQLSVALQ